MGKLARKLLKHEDWLLRIAVVFPVLWAGIRGILNPSAWVGFVPGIAADVVDPEMFLLFSGFVWIVASIALIAGFMRPLFAFIIFLGLTGILVFYGIDDVTFRDVGLAIAAFVLFLREARD